MVATNRRLARSDRAAKKLRGIKRGVGIKLTKAVHVLNIYARVPVTINGFLVSIDRNFVVFRHKKTNASKKTRVSTFPRNSIIEVFGNPGEPSQVTLWRRNLLSTCRGYVNCDNKRGTITIVDLVNEEPSTVFLSDELDIELYADEEEKAQRLPKKRKKVKSSKDEDEDEDDSDDSDEEDFEEDDEDSEEL